MVTHRCVDASLAGARQVQGWTGVQELRGKVFDIVVFIDEGAVRQSRWRVCALGAAERIQAIRDDKVLHLE